VHRRRRQRTLDTRTPPRRTRSLHLDTLVIYARQKDWKLDQVTVDIDTTTRPHHAPRASRSTSPAMGRSTVDHGRVVAIARVIVAIGLGFFAPKVESALSGAGWQANGSESVQARKLIQANFAGHSSSALMVVVHSSSKTVSDTGFRSTIASVERTLRIPARRARPGPGIRTGGFVGFWQWRRKGNPSIRLSCWRRSPTRSCRAS
jgi:hypothetical protein